MINSTIQQPNPKKKSSFHLNVGTSSILMIFVILCLVSFATLSIVSANADNKLSSRVLERTTAYYNACNEAEISLSKIDDTLISAYQSSATMADYFDAVGHTVTFTVPISDLQTLHVGIEILYPVSDEDTFYRITQWQVINEDSL